MKKTNINKMEQKKKVTCHDLKMSLKEVLNGDQEPKPKASKIFDNRKMSFDENKLMQQNMNESLESWESDEDDQQNDNETNIHSDEECNESDDHFEDTASEDNSECSEVEDQLKTVEEVNDKDEFKIWTEDNFDIEDFQDDMNAEYLEEETEDYEDEESVDGVVTQKIINSVSKNLYGNKQVSALKKSQHLLTAAILSIKNSSCVQLKSHYTLKGPEMFRSVVTMCSSHVTPCLHKILLVNNKFKAGPKWKKVAHTVKQYLCGLIALLNLIKETHKITVLIKQGILPLLPIVKEFPLMSRILCKNLIQLWATKGEEVQVQSVIVMFKLMKAFSDEHYERAMKAMYTSYIKNSQFTSPETLPGIQFMRVSLAELYSLDPNLAYSHGFIYIKQLTLNLKNAIKFETQERIDQIANWQYLHGIHFWAEVLGKLSGSAVLSPLIHPLAQVCVCAMNILHIPKYYPGIFHLCNIVSELCRSTQTSYVPITGHLLKILEDRSLFLKENKTSKKTFKWSSIIKVTSSQMQESAFQDGIIEQLYGCLLNFVASQSHSIAFPEIVTILSRKLLHFIEKCSVSNYSKKMKQITDKIDENVSFIENRRKYVTFQLKDSKAIRNWEIETSQASPPLETFYRQFIKEKQN